FRAFGLEANVSFAGLALAAAGDFLAVDGQLDDAVVAGDAVMIPFGRRLAAPFAGEAALRIFRRVRPIRHHRRAPDRKNVAVARVGFGVAAVEDLDFDTAAKRRPDIGQRVAPDENAGVAHWLHVPPF